MNMFSNTMTEEWFPLSAAQHSRWFMYRLAPQAQGRHNNVFTVRLRGAVDEAAMAQALRTLSARHPMLRARFRQEGDELRQSISSITDVPLQTVSAETWDEPLLRTRVMDDVLRPFALTSAPPVRAALYRRSPDDWVFTLVLDHLVSDGWSYWRLLGELGALLGSASASHAATGVTQGAVQYRDYIDWQRNWLEGADAERQLGYWRDALDGELPLLALPFERLNQTGCGTPASVTLQLPAELSRRLDLFAKSHASSLFVCLLAAYQILLHRYTGQDEIIVGCPMPGRGDGAWDDVVGDFVNVVALRARFDASPTVAAALRSARNTAMRGMANQDYPFTSLVERLRLSRGDDHPAFQTMFAFQKARHDGGLSALWSGADVPGLRWGQLGLTAYSIPQSFGIDGMCLVLQALELEGGLGFDFGFDAGRFDAAAIERLATSFRVLLESMVEDDQQSIDRLPLLRHEDRQQLLTGFNDTAVDYETGVLVHTLFERQVPRTPDAVALVYEQQQLSYAELNRRANQLAHYLRAQGVRPDDLVAICMERSVEMVVGLLGILKAGGAYVPLDPSLPRERLDQMLVNCAPVMLLTHAAVRDRMPRTDMPQLWLDQATQLSEQPDDNPDPLEVGLAAHHLAYVIYTSGSTGTPKGAMNQHDGVVNRLQWAQQQFALDAGDRVLQKTPYGFDVSVWEFFLPLLAGAQLVLARPGGHQLPLYLAELIEQRGITVAHFVPSMLRVFIDQAELPRCRSLRHVLCSGEALPADVQDRFLQRLPTVPLHNLYGPTEAAVDVTYWRCREGEHPVPIGAPIANTRIYILDAYLQPVPIGVAGELYIGGIQVGRGYWRREELTGERFVPDPFGDGRTRLYKTGDLARWRPDGVIEYLGRNDFQVKLRGFRIELGEIEARLAACAGVRQSAVIAREDVPGDPRLVAYIAPNVEQALPILRLLSMERRERASLPARFDLPDGNTVFHHNPRETQFLYEEIFTGEAYLKHGITLHDECCVFDVGANIGLFSLFVGQRFAGARIHAFEPIPPVFDTLRRNAELHDLQAIVHDFGLAAAPGEAKFTFYPRNTVISSGTLEYAQTRAVMSAYLRSQNGTQALDGAALDDLLEDTLRGETYRCRLGTVSEVIRAHGVSCIDLLKVDVEGGEHEVLKGIDDEDWPKIRQLVIEVHDIDDRLEQILTLLHMKGYEVARDQDDSLEQTTLHNLYARRPQAVKQTAERRSHVPQLPRWGSKKAFVEHLRTSLQSVLPDYMVPSAFVLLEALPLSPNGKLDRRAPPVPDRDAVLAQAYEAPANERERLLAELWRNLLGVERVGRNDHFFELGGHSLLATQVIARLRMLMGVELELREVFARPVLKDLAAALESAKQADAAIPRIERDGPLPLSWAQQRLWFLDQLAPAASAAYHLPAVVRLSGTLQRDALRAALDQIVARHEILRTCFVQVEGRPMQRIGAANQGLALIEHDLSALDKEAREANAAQWSAHEAVTPFDLATGPLIRGRLLRLSAIEHLLLITQHHIVSDGRSLGVLMHEVVTLYTAFSRGEADPLPALPLQYADYAVWQRQHMQGPERERLLNYWCDHLANAPALLELPTKQARPAVQSYAGSSVPITLPAELTARLRDMSRRHGTTLFMTLLTGWSVLLSRLSGQQEVVIGTPVANRQRSELEGLIGLFVNTLALRIRLDGDPSVAQLLEQVRATALNAYAHQDLPFDQVVEALNPSRSLSHSPIFQSMLAMDNTTDFQAQLPDLQWRAGANVHAVTHFDLTLLLADAGEVLSGSIEYASDLFDAHTVARWADHLRTLLDAMATDDRLSLSRLPTGGDGERWLATANDTLDRAALPMPDRTTMVSREYAEPHGEMEEAMARLWEAVLGVQRVGRDDHFFELGGHSLSLTKLAFDLKERFGVDIKLSQLYEWPVMQDMAASVEARREQARKSSESAKTVLIDL